MIYYEVVILLLTLLVKLITVSNAQPAPGDLLWQDNFDGPFLNEAFWSFDEGDGCDRKALGGDCGWGNNEFQVYTRRQENVRIENGTLLIEVRNESFNNHLFTSGRLLTKDKFAFTYGTVEARIKLPNVNNGLWPAFWMLGATEPNWPLQGEIDIMEQGAGAALANGTGNRLIGSTVHWLHDNQYRYFGTFYEAPVDLYEDFHLFKIYWDPNVIRAYLDNHEYYAIDIRNASTASLSAFHHDYYFLLNVAVGGNYPQINRTCDITAALPARMEVDYIRVYRLANSSITS